MAHGPDPAILSSAALVPGTLVRLAERPEWGLGQVQSAVGGRVTINFEHAGKQLVLADRVTLLAAGKAGD